MRKIFNEYGKENCKLDLVASYPCHSKQALLKREGFQIQTTEGINRCVAGTINFKMIQTIHNPLQLHEERIKQGYERTKTNGKHKEFRDNHKEEAKEYRKGYRDLEKSKKRNLNKARNNIMKGQV